jgi:hypothetical protein
MNWSGLAGALSIAVLVAGLALGSRAASGGDSYGYVSQAQLWRQGSLIQPAPLARSAKWPNAAETLAPLGYRPARNAFAIVPTYAPGLPILMALARVVGGPCAVYFVVPISAALLVWLTYVLALRVSDPVVAAGSAMLVATSPTLLFMTMWPMSDVPVSAFWIAALLSAWRGDRAGRAVLTGVLTGIAILIRPNLVLLAVVPAGLVLHRAATTGGTAMWRAVAAFAAGALPFVGAIVALNAFLYGSPLESGYGSLSRLYSVDRIQANFVRHVGWLYESQGPYLFACLIGLVVHVRRGASSLMLWGAGLLALVWIAYLPYHVFSEWWYLRFLLPAFPVVCVLAVDGVAALAGRFGARVRLVVTGAFVLAAAAYGLSFAIEREIAGLGEGEQRAVEVGHFAKDDLPSNAMLISGQQSGSLRYYSGRATLRYDRLDPAWLDRTVEQLRAMSYHPFAVLESWEEATFRNHFRGQATLKLLDASPAAVLDSNVSVSIYDLAPRLGDARPASIRHIPRSQCREPEDR